MVAVDTIPVVAASSGNGVCWTLPDPGDLNVNVVRLEPGGEMADHVNDEVDVLYVALTGQADLFVGDRHTPLRPGTVAHVPRGSRRRLRADSAFGYLSVHRRRPGPVIASPR